MTPTQSIDHLLAEVLALTEERSIWMDLCCEALSQRDALAIELQQAKSSIRSLTATVDELQQAITQVRK